MKVNINRQAAGLEDLLFGVGTVQQDRQGQLVTVTKINAGNMPFDGTNTLAEILIPINTQIIPNLTEILAADNNAVIATNKALEAFNSAAAALSSEQSAVSLLDQFDDRYLGSKALDPLTDNDGNQLLVGALYWNTTVSKMKVWSISLVWVDAITGLTDSSISTLTNKVLDNISNTIGANHIHYPIRNVSGITINSGTIVTAQGTQSGTDYIEVVPVTNPQTQIALGIMHNTVVNNGTGLCMNTGVCADIVNTSGWTVGTLLYPNTTGGLTNTKPTAGQYQTCAVVLRSHVNQGTLLIEFTEPEKIASTTQAGYVQLVNTLTSTSTTEALTAAQGKVLQDRLVTVENGTVQEGDSVTLTGDVTGVATFDVDGNLTLSTTVVDDSHNHTIANIGLVGAIGNINSPLLDMPLKNSLAMKSGVGSATFTRASTATYIDRYGMLKTAAIDEPRFEKEGYLNEGASTNLLTYSEDFSNAIWTKIGGTISANTTDTLDPYGTTLADKFIEDSTTSQKYVLGVYTTPVNVNNTISIYAKSSISGNKRYLGITIANQAATGNFCDVVFDVALGTISNSARNVGNATLASATITLLSNGYYRCTLSGIADTSGTQLRCIIGISNLGTNAIPSYLGDGTSGVYIFGAQLEALPFATSYIPTTTAAATRSADILNVTRGGNLPNLEVNGELSILLDFDTIATSSYTNEQNIFGNVTTGTDKYLISTINGTNNLNSYKQYYLNSVDTTALSQTKTVLPNTKTRMVSTLNNTYESLYLNGILANSRVRTGGRITQTQNSAIQTTRIGGYSAGSTTYGLFGHISNVRIFDKVLSAQEVALV